jgi:hypothetical protein
VVAVAFVEMLLRLAEVIYAPFYALFLVGPAALLIEHWMRRDDRLGGDGVSQGGSMRRVFVTGIVLFTAVVAGAMALGQRSQATQVVEVFKTPTCGCCSLWVEHLKASGFTTKVTDLTNLSPVKAQHQVPGNLQSCHTAVVDGYVIEGHVPAADIQRLLKERPNVAGLAVPGMPAGSPGMEAGGRVDRYDVVSFTDDGKTAVFASYPR